MSVEEKLEALSEVFEDVELKPETELSGLQWDSMAMLGVIALAKANGVSLPAAKLREFRTVGDILDALSA